MCNLGMCLEGGHEGHAGETCMYWYDSAMKIGSEKARYHVARCHYNGIAVVKDVTKAADVMGKAVWDLGNAFRRCCGD